jgi:hypothetical protein
MASGSKSGEGKQAQARPSFLKKRSKKLFPVLASAFADGLSPDNPPGGRCLFSKKNRFLPSPDCPASHAGFAGRERGDVLALVRAHRQVFLEAWHGFFGSGQGG